jgi:hypothetical protein
MDVWDIFAASASSIATGTIGSADPRSAAIAAGMTVDPNPKQAQTVTTTTRWRLTMRASLIMGTVRHPMTGGIDAHGKR